METGRLLNRELWRWYILLVIANELDLVYTYFGLSHGRFLEANPIIRPHLYTWWPIAMKAAGLAGLALAVALVLQMSLPRQRRVLEVLRLVTAVYVVVLVMHVVNMLTMLRRG